MFASLDLTKISLKDILSSYGLDINEKSLYALIFGVVILLFLYATARALYQWLAPKFGVTLPNGISRFLLLGRLKENTGRANYGKWSWKTFFIISMLVILTRLLIYYTVYAVKVNQAVGAGYPFYGFFESFENIWNRWDSPHYIDIARDWYVTQAQVTPPNDSYLYIVFFPLFPLLMRISGALMPDPNNDFYFWSGCVISLISMCVGCTYFYRLVKAECSKKVAVWSLLFLLFTPASFFFGICYTEALFLCLCVMFFYYLRKGNYMVAAVIGALAAFTRSLGVLLAIPYFAEWLDCEATVKQPVKTKILRLLPIFVITMGTLAYLAINYVIYDDPLKFTVYQLHWGQQFSFFADNIADIGVRALTWDNVVTTLVMWLPEFLVIIGTIALFAVGSGNKLRPSYLGFMMVYIIFAAAPSWLLSGVRYFAVLFPVFILLGQFAGKHKLAGGAVLLASSVAMIFYALGFANGMQIM